MNYTDFPEPCQKIREIGHDGPQNRSNCPFSQTVVPEKAGKQTRLRKNDVGWCQQEAGVDRVGCARCFMIEDKGDPETQQHRREWESFARELADITPEMST